jgi:hypothetical protein
MMTATTFGANVVFSSLSTRHELTAVGGFVEAHTELSNTESNTAQLV